MNSKSVFETFKRSVPPRLASPEPACCELALAAPAKLDATSNATPIAAIASESVSLLCIRFLPSTLPSLAVTRVDRNVSNTKNEITH